jgi:hypothetical protein
MPFSDIPRYNSPSLLFLYTTIKPAERRVVTLRGCCAQQRFSLVWDFIPNICCEALASKTGIALIKPRTYQQKGTYHTHTHSLLSFLCSWPLWC